MMRSRADRSIGAASTVRPFVFRIPANLRPPTKSFDNETDLSLSASDSVVNRLPGAGVEGWMVSMERMAHGRMHYGWIVAAITFVTLLAAAGIRATPGVLIVPLEQEFGWTRASISLAVSGNLGLHGLLGPFSAGRGLP